jgi:hypothetical protein
MLLTIGGIVAGCTPSPPTTTFTDASGESITVDWSEYPADAYTGAEEVLDLPPVEDVERRWSRVRGALTDAIQAELGGEFGDLAWRKRGDDGWYESSGNGYGGDTMLQVYNSAGWEAGVRLPRSVWPRVLQAAEEELAQWGITVAKVDSSADDDDANAHARWLLVRDFFSGGEFMSVSVQDATLEDDALADVESYGGLVSGIALFYGIQTISESDRDAFARAALPFEGLTRPAPTHSD